MGTPSADDIELEHCFGALCAGGCSNEPCAWYAHKVREVRFENARLTFASRGREFVVRRKGPERHGTYKGEYEARIRLARE